MGEQVQTICYTIHIAFSGHILGVAFSNMTLDLPECIQITRLKGRAFQGILLHIVDTSTSNTNRHCGKPHAFDFQVSHHAQNCTIDIPNDVRVGRYQDIFKDKLCCIRCSHTKLILNLLTETKSFHTFLNNKLSDVHFILSCPCVYQKNVTSSFSSQGSICNPHLSSIQYKAIQIFIKYGSCFHTKNVGTSTWFAHTHSTNFTSGTCFR
mmetsp:Transcript_17031/g.30820  ORF Transcript_17031/g.30820 Transcript_17031/m.30820 type:complete len:209 (-) Transcript_17031:530-1156(-)